MSNPPELGAVTFSRDFDGSLVQSKETGKPIFLLFQEIPGCSTCTNFGKNVLSHPKLVPSFVGCYVTFI